MRRHLAVLAICALLAVSLLSGVSADEPVVRDEAVLARQATMKSAKAALAVLGEMSALRRHFDRAAARAARTRLLEALSDLPDRFEQPHSDRHTRARPEIWENWPAFLRSAEAARQAARGLRTNNLPALRRSLPAVMSACLACHSRYRTGQ
ncbi:cytochrome c [Ruegeria sp. PrR005]|uniref:Cytochrome c n=1 Tax=Ruegeria sp. PrR005 TaxID=2706882 RepID=A0A6B2NTM6_9RHOB|nr:cytochrome c [Ruegeria sp. PrR005]NDW46073.1 cytochrome c [Ruegeria sp. PrR005]